MRRGKERPPPRRRRASRQNSGLANAGGGLIGSITYDGFGNIRTDTTGSSGDHVKYTGRDWDAAIHLQHNGARYYDPAIGKWTSIDPIGFDAGEPNLYRDVGNETMTSRDPWGLFEWSWGGAVGGGFTGGVIGAGGGALIGAPFGGI